MKYDAILFDLDGTLLDTSEGVLASVDFVIKSMGLNEISENELKSFIGPPIQESFKKIYGMDDLSISKAASLFRDRYKSVDLLKADAYEGLIPFLETLKNNNILLGVATYKREDYAIELLEKINIAKYMDCIFGGDSNNELTKQDIIMKCINKLNVKPQKIVMIGDTKFDALGAEAAGIDFLAVTYGFGFKTTEDLKSLKYIGVAKTVEDINKIMYL